MQIDPELITHVLNHVAGQAEPVSARDIWEVPGHTRDSVHKHVGILIEHELLQGAAHAVHGLTEKGHALRLALCDKNVQAKLRHASAHLGEAVTIHVLLDIAKAFMIGL